MRLPGHRDIVRLEVGAVEHEGAGVGMVMEVAVDGEEASVVAARLDRTSLAGEWSPPHDDGVWYGQLGCIHMVDVMLIITI